MAASSDDRGNERAGGGGEEEAEEKTDGWLTTYADMVTLLLTFFVLLVAMSATDNERVEMFLMAMSREGITAEQFYEIQDKYRIDDFSEDSWDEFFPRPEDGEHQDSSLDQGGDEAMQGLYQDLSEYIMEMGLQDHIALQFNGEFLLLSLASDILFESGSAEMTLEMQENAQVIASMLSDRFKTEDPFEIVVAGHTDNVPIDTPQYPSNWHLSMDRASNFLYELINWSELDPSLFYARGCGEYRPIASNDTPEGRQMNRRVEVMVSLARDNPLWDRGDQQHDEIDNSTW